MLQAALFSCMHDFGRFWDDAGPADAKNNDGSQDPKDASEDSGFDAGTDGGVDAGDGGGDAGFCGGDGVCNPREYAPCMCTGGGQGIKMCTDSCVWGKCEGCTVELFLDADSDTYVDSERPDDVFGMENHMDCGWNDVTKARKWTMIKFPVPDLIGKKVNQAVLYMYGIACAGSISYKAGALIKQFSEETTNYNNSDKSISGTTSPAGSNENVSLDVTEVVRNSWAAIDPNIPNFGLLIFSNGTSDWSCAWHSRHAGSDKPKLFLSYDE